MISRPCSLTVLVLRNQLEKEWYSFLPQRKTSHLSFKLDFKVTNNVAEYEALLLGLNAAKEKGIKKLQVFGDADLIIQQVNKSFQAKHVRLKAYRDEVLEAIQNFSYFKITFVPRAMNEFADSLAVSACAFIPPLCLTNCLTKFKLNIGPLFLTM
jgi:ribonuclease HI